MPYADREKRLEYNRKYNKETQEWAKKNGICVVCCKQKADEGKDRCKNRKFALRQNSYLRRVGK